MKPGLENFEHYFTSVRDEGNCAVAWAFFGIAYLWDWNKTVLFQSCSHCWVFQFGWHIECSTFTASSFRIWKSSTEIPSPPLSLFIMMLPKTYLTLVSILWHSTFFMVQLSHPYMTTGKTIILTRWTFVGKVMSLLLNMLSRLVIAFFQGASVF